MPLLGPQCTDEHGWSSDTSGGWAFIFLNEKDESNTRNMLELHSFAMLMNQIIVKYWKTVSLLFCAIYDVTMMEVKHFYVLSALLTFSLLLS